MRYEVNAVIPMSHCTAQESKAWMARLGFSPRVVLLVCVTEKNCVEKGWYGHKTLEMLQVGEERGTVEG